MRRLLPPAAVLLLLLLAGVAFGCGSESAVPPAGGSGGHPWLGGASERVRAAGEGLRGDPSGAIVVDYPEDGTLFPPDFVSPTFLWHDGLWHDGVGTSDTWLIRVEPAHAPGEAFEVLVPGTPPPEGRTDPEAFGATNEAYRPTPYQASARTWTPSAEVWTRLQRISRDGPVELTFTGIAAAAPEIALSRGRVSIRTSTDPVGAPIFYRDVPLMPDVGETGVIQPLSRRAIPLIEWRLKDVTRPDSRMLLTGMPSCANCHSFSRDGSTLAMDVDGPQGDKGAYAIVRIQPETTIGPEQVITWNSFPDKPKDHKTIGFLSRISPDGRYVVSTVNEALYVANFTNYRFLQVFFPTRGILAFYDTQTKAIRGLPGADLQAYVQCDPVWTPDGETIVFARAAARDPYERDKPLATQPNDPNEPQIQYDLCTIPFRGGEGGTAMPIPGASANGWSNTFPKVTPDGRFIVFVRCRNGQLLRPDGRLCIVPIEGGEVREMRCNTALMNSWHSFSPNGRWMVFTSKVNTPYTQMFLTHLDEEGSDTPPVLIPNATASNRAVNLPEFLNAPYDALKEIVVPAVNHHVHFQRGQELIRSERFQEAKLEMEKALRVDPTFSRALASLGLIHQRLGDDQAARSAYERALELDPRNARVLTNLGTLLMQADEVEGAIALWRRALDVDPFDDKAHNNLGVALGMQNRYEEAAAHFAKAWSLNPTLASAQTNLGITALRRGHEAEALEHFERALAVDPADVRARRGAADLLEARGRTREAVPHLEALLAKDPDDAYALTRLAWIRATAREDALRDGARALEMAQRAVAGTQLGDPRALDALAAAFAETGDFTRAAQAATRALTVADPNDVDLVRAIRERLRLYGEGRVWRAAR